MSLIRNMETITLKIQNMHCSSCAMNIDGELEDMPGVKSASTSYARATTSVEYDPGLLTVEKLLEAVKRAGYNGEVIEQNLKN